MWDGHSDAFNPSIEHGQHGPERHLSLVYLPSTSLTSSTSSTSSASYIPSYCLQSYPTCSQLLPTYYHPLLTTTSYILESMHPIFHILTQGNKKGIKGAKHSPRSWSLRSWWSIAYKYFYFDLHILSRLLWPYIHFAHSTWMSGHS